MGTAGGRHCADVRGAYSEGWAEKPATVEPEAEEQIGSTCPATAPLFEVAAAHDGQPAKDWLTMFYRMYGSLE